MFCWAKTIRNLKHPLSSNRFGHVHKSTAVFYASLTSRLKRIKCRVNRPLQRLNFSRWNGTSSLFSFFSIADLIVAVGDQIEILTNGSHSNPLTLKSYNASVLVALAYDPSSQRLYFSDKRNRRGHVFSVSFDGIKAEGSVHDVIESNGLLCVLIPIHVLIFVDVVRRK